MQEIIVTQADDQEARACLALLPSARDLPVELLIARRRGAFAGAAAIYWQSWSRPHGFPTILHVVPEERGHGVGSRLLEVAAALAADEADGLWSFDVAEDDSEEARFMLARGFKPQIRRRYFRASIGVVLGHITPLLERLKVRTSAVRTVMTPLAEAPLEEVAWLVSAELGGDPRGATARLQQRLAGVDEVVDGSQVAMREGRVAGAILCRLEDGAGVVDARVVAAPYRRGPMNLMLLEAGLKRAQAQALAEVRFHCDDTNRDTLSLAKWCAAVETETNALYYYAIAAR